MGGGGGGIGGRGDNEDDGGGGGKGVGPQRERRNCQLLVIAVNAVQHKVAPAASEAVSRLDSS